MEAEETAMSIELMACVCVCVCIEVCAERGKITAEQRRNKMYKNT